LQALEVSESSVKATIIGRLVADYEIKPVNVGYPLKRDAQFFSGTAQSLSS
jgi:hypothetical protein